MKLYNEDYYESLGDEIATEALGVKEAHKSLKAMQEEIDNRLNRIAEIKKLLPKKREEAHDLRAEATSLQEEYRALKEAIASSKGKKEVLPDLIAELEDTKSAGLIAEQNVAEIEKTVTKLEKELEELEIEEANYRKGLENNSSKKFKKLKKNSLATADNDPDDGYDGDEPVNPAIAEKDPAFQKNVQALIDAAKESEMGNKDLSEDRKALEEAKGEEQLSNAEQAAITDIRKVINEAADPKPIDYSVSGKVVPRMVIVKEDNDMVRTVNDLEFYNNLGKDALDFDRGKGMTGSLREWIKSAIADDEEISDVVVEQILPQIMSADPDMIDLVKQVLIAAEEEAVPYIPVFVSKIDGTRYYDKSDAEASIEQLTRAGITDFGKVFEIKHQIAEFEGVEDAPFVPTEEVEYYISNFDGDKNLLRQRLFIEKPKKKATNADGKKSDKKDDDPEA